MTSKIEKPDSFSNKFKAVKSVWIGLSGHKFATVAGVHEVDRRVRGVDTDMDTLFRRGSSDAGKNCRKMGRPQRRIKEGGFEGDGASISIRFASIYQLGVNR